MTSFSKIQSKGQRASFDFWLISTTAVLILVGLLTIYDASVVAAARDFGDKLYYFKNQVIWVFLGLGALVVFSFFSFLFFYFCFLLYAKKKTCRTKQSRKKRKQGLSYLHSKHNYSKNTG